ncbi:MAG: class A beta-lactamase-related serine hydrolase [Acidobacteriota bacterium]|nr:class A beta-lactamase-related serine hydrolase [Acidobacteriota bacterium]MDW3229188.1 class A beta-lactamase-related serine hydrolase [Acidobacteriota bacterium]
MRFRENYFLALLTCLAIFLICLQLPGKAEDKIRLLENRLVEQLAAINDSFDGVLGLAVKDLSTGKTFFINENESFPQASSIKIAILLEVLKQAEEKRLQLEDFIELKPEDKVGGGLILAYLGRPSLKISIYDLCVLMVVLSDNTATNLLIDQVGMESVNKRLESLGLPSTRLKRKMMDLTAAAEGRENISTPVEMMKLLERIWQGKILKSEYRQQFFNLLALPKDSPLQRAVPEGTIVADKPGELEAVRCDSGIVILKHHPYLICVMTTYLLSETEGNTVITKIGRLVFNHFDRLERSSKYGRIISER